MTHQHGDFDIFTDNYEGEALIPEDGCTEDEEFVYDEEGGLELARTIAARIDPEILRPREPLVRPFPFVRPCSLKTLNGSWLLQFQPTFPQIFSQIRGPMRIELDDSRLHISGDVYAKTLLWRAKVAERPEVIESITPRPLIIRRNWYPAYPQNQYSWYFRSLGVHYLKGVLTFKFERHLWDRSREEFTSTDRGWMRLQCQTSLIRWPRLPQPTIAMKGTATIGGRTYNVTATKTSPYYRGCLVEVDVMQNRTWPSTAQSCDGSQTYSFTGVYRGTGMDFVARVNEVNIPEDPQLTRPELQTLLASHRSLSPGGDNWHLWMFVGSKENGTFGVMFDQTAPHREGVVAYYDPTMPPPPEFLREKIEASARGKKLGEVPLAFLRTIIHEAGHAFNLFHPKHDVHGVAKGTTIMNQTGDVIGFATTSNPYPCNATMGFNEHNRASLAHSPDPQVKPGWKPFGWGHGSLWSGIAEPVDALGMDAGAPDADGLTLDLQLPQTAHRGEFITAKLTVTNTGDRPRLVSSALNLAEDDLKVTLTDPSGTGRDLRDVVVVCGVRHMIELAPKQSVVGTVQVFYNNRGFSFDQFGHYSVRAEFQVGDEEDSILVSKAAKVIVRPATTDDERELERLMMDEGVGASIALGDFGGDTATQERLVEVMDRFGDKDTVAACAMVVANSLSRDFRDVRADRVVRPADTGTADRAMDVALKGRDATSAAQLAVAVVSPRETAAPLLDVVQARLKRARKGTYTAEDLSLADKIIKDQLTK